jgi:crotonobetainyl-CoA:carnitine CoA-transferase CaiB-like acyl-CoA transferase
VGAYDDSHGNVCPHPSLLPQAGEGVTDARRTVIISSQPPPATTPLGGITVIEHAAGVAASYAGRLLAVMGTTVIKVEPLGDVENRFARSFKNGGVLECRDGYIQVLTLEPRQWQGLVKLLGNPAWALQPAMNDALERGRRGAQINRHLRAWTKVQSVAVAVARGQALGVLIAKYQSPVDIFDSAQSQARGMFSTVELPAAGAAPGVDRRHRDRKFPPPRDGPAEF